MITDGALHGTARRTKLKSGQAGGHGWTGDSHTFGLAQRNETQSRSNEAGDRPRTCARTHARCAHTRIFARPPACRPAFAAALHLHRGGGRGQSNRLCPCLCRRTRYGSINRTPFYQAYLRLLFRLHKKKRSIAPLLCSASASGRRHRLLNLALLLRLL